MLTPVRSYYAMERKFLSHLNEPFLQCFHKGSFLVPAACTWHCGELVNTTTHQDTAIMDVLMQCREQALQQLFGFMEVSVSHISSSLGRLSAVIINP